MFENVSEVTLRLAVFALAFGSFAVLELLRPRSPLKVSKVRRWLTNLTIIGVDSLLVRIMASLAIPLVATAAAVYAANNGIGLFNVLDWPPWLEFTLSVVALDLAIWFQHLASHKVPLFWRLHQMHHADRDIDVTTAIRFHPIEIALSMLWKIACVLALGASVAAVIAFEIILNATAIFSHANIRLPDALDRIIRLVIVTPDMHRVHHSVLKREHDSNFGFNFSFWDRLFRTYRAKPEKGFDGMTIGLPRYQSEAPSNLWWSLTIPFKPWPKNWRDQNWDQQ